MSSDHFWHDIPLGQVPGPVQEGKYCVPAQAIFPSNPASGATQSLAVEQV